MAIALVLGCQTPDAGYGAGEDGEGTSGISESDSETGGDPSPQGWTRIFDGTGSDYDAAYGIAADANGDVMIVGVTTESINDGGRNILLQKYRGVDGTLLWTTSWDGPAGGDDLGFGISIGTGGDFFVAGGSTPLDDARDIFVGRFDPDGMPVWTHVQDGSANDHDTATGLATAEDGSFVIAGRWTETPEAGGVNAVLRKYSADGEILWTRVHDGEAHSDDSYVDVVSTGSLYYGIGTEATLSTGSDATITAISEDGEALWTHAYDWGLDDNGSAISRSSEGLLITGSLTRPNGTSEVWAAELDLDGEERWLNISHDGRTLISHGITADAYGEVWITGLSAANEGSEDIWTRIFDSAGVPLNTEIHEGPAGATDIGSEVCRTVDGTAVFIAAQETSATDSGGVNAWIRKIVL